MLRAPMLFNSWSFLIFYPVVTGLYFVTPGRARWVLLLVASAYFYMAFVPRYILILLLAIGVDYAAGLLIGRSTGSARRRWLIVSVLVNVGILAFFKYFNFINDNLRVAAQSAGFSYGLANLDIVLPIGLSFHIFQSLSYTIEVYRGKQAPERHLGIYALYVMFYPQLVAGPIERPQNLLHQFHAEHPFDAERMARGHRRMLWGYFKKVVVADRLAPMVAAIYGAPREHHGLPLIVATLCFSIQIYCDFSGYSDIALGAADTMGVDLMRNFRTPYFSRSISEFWTRWHISLSTWFRDYVYIPLGGNRVSRARWAVNLVVVFLLSGLWHGANWTFIVWGALHALYLVVAIVTGPLREQWRPKLSRAVSEPVRAMAARLGVFALVSFAWIFFRAASVSDALYIASHLTSGLASQLSPAGVVDALRRLHTGRDELFLAVAAIGILLAVDAWGGRLATWIDRLPRAARWATYYTAMAGVLLLGVHSSSAFIYFQF